MKKTYIIFVTVFLMQACNKDEIVNTSDCYPTRKIVASIDVSEGFVVAIGSSFYLSDSDYTRYITCEIPEELKKDSTKVAFKGLSHEIYKFEKLIGRPLTLSWIDKR